MTKCNTIDYFCFDNPDGDKLAVTTKGGQYPSEVSWVSSDL